MVTMRLAALVGAVAGLVGAEAQAVSQSRGYALMFQGSAPVAAIKKGLIDFTDPGMSLVDTEITMMFWATMADGNGLDLRLQLHWTNEADINYFQPFVETSTFFFGNLLNAGIPAGADQRLWHHYAATYSQTTDAMTLYMDGQVINTYSLSKKFSLQGPPGTTETSFYIGANLYQRVTKMAVSYPAKAHFGKMDDVTVFHRALTQAEIEAFYTTPIERGSVPADAVLHYDFDVTCPGTPGTSPGLQDPACELAGDQLVPNLGSAGSDYDLLLGEMNNDHGFGKTWAMVGGGNACPVQYPFAVPTIIPSDSPAGNALHNPAVPTVVFATSSSSVDFELPSGHNAETFTVASLPQAGTVANDGSVLSVGDNVAGTDTLTFIAPASMNTPVWFHFTLSGGGSHEVHVWPLEAPEIDPVPAPSNLLMADMLEDSDVVIRTTIRAIAKAGEVLEVLVHKLPTKGLLQDMAEVEDEDTALDNVTLAVGSQLTHPAGLVKYTPLEDLFGTNADSFELVFRSPLSGLQSPVLTVSINIEGVDDMPTAEDASASIMEDNTTGVVIPLTASDSESRHGVVISKLPEHGTLYTSRTDGEKESHDLAVVHEYQIFDVGTVIEQYASELIKVSSYWGGPPYLGYHAINVLGRQSCWGKANGECVDERPFDSYEVGDLIRVPEYFSEDVVNYYRHAHIERIYEENGERKYDVRVLPMQRAVDNTLPYEDWTLVPCVLVGPSYPADCSPEEATKHDPKGPLLVGITNADITTLSPAVWCPLTKGMGGVVSGLESAIAYGSQFGYRNHSGTDTYANSSPPYTEYVEVKFDKPVFVAGIEIGSPRGAGAVVAIRVKDPDTDEWVAAFTGSVQLEAQTEFNLRGLYHKFSPTVCRPFFASDTVRIELDTSEETGIADWNYIDYIKLFGAEEVQPALLTRSSVKYVPDPNFFGTDTFEITSYDCGGDHLRASEPGVVTVQVSAIDDKPSVLVHAAGVPKTETGAFKYNMSKGSGAMEFELTALEVDGESVEMRVRLNPGSEATLALGPTSLAVGSFGQVHFINATYTRSACTWLSKNMDFFDIDVQDANKPDMGSTVRVQIEIDCDALPRELSFAEPSGTASAVAVALGALGIVIALVCLGFNLVFRKRQVVRLTSPNMNAIIITGAIFVYGYLMTFQASINGAAGCEEFLAALQEDALDGRFNVSCDLHATTSCCHSSATIPCKTQPALLSIGIVMTFGSLFSKTVRLQKLFMAKLRKIKRISDNQLIVRVALLLFILIVYLLAWMVASPQHMSFEVGQETLAAGSDVISTPLLGKCTSNSQEGFIAGLLVYVGGLLVYGAFLAYSVRNINVPAANDSKQIAISVYNIILFGGLNMIITEFIPDPSALLVMLSVITFLCTTSTLMILFVPRMVDIYQGNTVSLGSSTKSGAAKTGVTLTGHVSTNASSGGKSGA